MVKRRYGRDNTQKQIEDGKRSIDQLIALHVDVCNQLAELSKQNAKLVEVTRKLEDRLEAVEPKNDDGSSPSEPYSLSAEVRRRRENLLKRNLSF
jgi:hypothetical protein